jgi:S-DNA-T family DNA segregation ATPase FtsK/SpoIIIE
VERRKGIKVTTEEKKEEPKTEKKAVQESFEFLKDIGPYKLPPVTLLDAVEKKEVKVDKETIQLNASILEKKLKDYGIEGKVTEVRPGPVITMYEFEPAPGIKVRWWALRYPIRPVKRYICGILSNRRFSSLPIPI